MKTATRTFQMRLAAENAGEIAALERMAETYQRVMRTLYAESRKTRDSFASFKTDYCRRYGLSSRQFNAIAIDLAGRVSSVHEKAAHDLEGAEDALAGTLSKIRKADEAMSADRDRRTEWRRIEDESKRRAAVEDAETAIRKRARKKIYLSQKRQRLEARISRLQRAAAASHPPMCFGSRKAFNAQHHLKENRFADHGAWLMHWRKRRENQFQVVGSNDEPGGNMTCRARIENDAVQLKLTTLGGEKICIGPLVLPYGHQEWLNAIMGGDAESRVAMDYQRQTADMVARYRERGCWPTDVLAKAAEDGTDPEKAFRRMRFGLRRKMAKLGHAVSYRFRRDEYGWRMFVTIEEPVADVQLNCTRGAIGIDMNADHLAIASVNHLGVPVGFARIDTHVTNRSSGQRLAMYRDAAASIVRQALDENRPIVVEELDFMAKRRRLGEVGCKKKTRMLSSFATTMFKGAIVSAAKRAGVAIRFVNPAFTSVIGLTKAVDLGVSVHLAAAVTIARRAMGFAEAVSQKIRIPAGHLKPSVLPVPEWLQGKPLDMKGMQEIASSIKGVLEARPKRQTGKERRLMNSASAFIAGLTFDTG